MVCGAPIPDYGDVLPNDVLRHRGQWVDARAYNGKSIDFWIGISFLPKQYTNTQLLKRIGLLT